MLWWLLLQVRSGNPKRRYEAARKLVRYKDSRVAKALVAALSDKGGYDAKGCPILVSIQAQESLEKLGPVAVDPLIEVFRDRGDHRRYAAARLLRRIRDERAVGPLSEELRAPNPDWTLEFRSNLIRALQEIGGKRSYEALLAVFNDPNVKDKEEVALALHAMGWQPSDHRESLTLAIAKKDWKKAESFGPRAVEKLVEFQEGRSPRSSEGEGVKDVLEVLGRIGGARAVSALLKRLEDDPYPETQELTVKALAQIGEPALPSILQDLEHYPKANKRAIRDVLKAMRGEKAAEALNRFFPDERASAPTEEVKPVGTALDLSNQDLSGRDFSRKNLAGAKLKHSNLSAANLSEANLEKADFWQSNLTNAKLVGAKLQGATLRGAKVEGIDLRNADMRQADLPGAQLTNATLAGADLSGADLNEANLTKADLSGARLCYASLRWANLRGAKLDGADFTRADLTGTKVYEADLSRLKFEGPEFSNADVCR